MQPSALDIVRKWHAALNEGNVDELVMLVQPDVEIEGPRGVTSGVDVVREWFGRANVRMQPLRYFQRGDVVVVEQLGEWLSPETREVTSSQPVSTLFTVSNGLISRIARYDTLVTALEKAQLSESDIVSA